MVKDIDLTSRKWLEIVFKGKNHDYGAYELRDDSSDRHIKALIIVTIVGLFLTFLPRIVQSVLPGQYVEQVTGVDLTDLDLDKDIPEQAEIEAPPPPPLLKETVLFTPPVITHDEDLKETNALITQEELSDSRVEISSTSRDAVDVKEVATVVQETKPQIFTIVEQPAQFPGGDQELLRYLSENIRYPVVAAEQGIQGRVVLKFVVRPDGSVGDVEVLRSLDVSCDKEAVRVVLSMPKWNPGKQNGKAVHVYFTLPVTFKLQ